MTYVIFSTFSLIIYILSNGLIVSCVGFRKRTAFSDALVIFRGIAAYNAAAAFIDFVGSKECQVMAANDFNRMPVTDGFLSECPFASLWANAGGISAFRLLWYGIMGFLILGYIVMPFARTVLLALRTDNGMGLLNFREFFTNPNQRAVARNTILLGLSMTFTCGTIGILLALYMTFLCGKYKKLIHILLLSPMMVPGVITVISFIQLYGESGILTKAIEYALHLDKAPYNFQGFGAILFVITYTQYVYFYLNVYVALKYLDYSAVEAARSLGASWPGVFRDVICPVIRPAKGKVLWHISDGSLSSYRFC